MGRGPRMKVAILAGGLGTRLQEETVTKPKPMVEVGGLPILWHIMKIYAAQGFNEFVIALGYKGEYIKDFFLNYRNRASNLQIDLKTGDVRCAAASIEDWKVHLIDTGAETMTGGRVKQLCEYIKEPFLLTYGDGVANVDMWELLKVHERSKALTTLTAVRPPARFGALQFDKDAVTRFEEKPQIGEGWINGGFFVVEPEVSRYIAGDETFWEREPLSKIADEGKLAAHRHNGFWQCMDTLRDVKLLNDLWASQQAPWKLWEKGLKTQQGQAAPTVIHQVNQDRN